MRPEPTPVASEVRRFLTRSLVLALGLVMGVPPALANSGGPAPTPRPTQTAPPEPGSPDGFPPIRAELDRSAAYAAKLDDLAVLAMETSLRAATIVRESDGLERLIASEERRAQLSGGAMVGRRFVAELGRVREVLGSRRDARVSRDQALELDLEAIDLGDRLDELQDLSSVVEAAIGAADPPPGMDPDLLIARLTEVLVAQRDERLVPLIAAVTKASAAFDELEHAEERLLEACDRYDRFILANLLSLRASDPTTPWRLLEGLALVPGIVAKAPWVETGWSIVGRSGVPVGVIASVVLLVALLAARPACGRILARTREQLLRPETDRFSATLLAAVATAVLVAPIPAAAGLLAWRLGPSEGLDPLAAALADTLSRNFALITLLGAISLTRRGGLAEAHFRWSPRVLGMVRRWAWILLLVLVPTKLLPEIIALGRVPLDEEAVAVQSILLVAALAWLAAAATLLNPRRGLPAEWLQARPGHLLARGQWIWYGALLIALLVPIVDAWQGYLFATNLALERIAASVGVILGVRVLRDLAVRWLQATSRQIASGLAPGPPSTATAAPPASASSATGTSPPSDPRGVVDPPAAIDLDVIHVQALRIITSIMSTVLLLGLLAAWSKFLPALRNLRDVTLWTVTREVPAAAGGVAREVVPIDLLHLLASVLSLVLTFVVARNVPGLVELVLLPRLPLTAGVRYAIVTLLRYVLGILGVVIALSFLGVQWSSVQWLVSAAVLGLSFGLQEIFKNLVSGVILLVEQPIRIGDEVTIGASSGRVTNIRMRATTLIDSDRRDVVIPNSALITGTVINWTLADRLARQVIHVGVAYGSDLRLVERLLLEIARRDHEVLRSPGPSVAVKEFGETGVTLDLRVVVADVARGGAVAHRLRLAIAEELARQGIAPFPKAGDAGAGATA